MTELELLKKWVRALMAGLDKEIDEKTKTRLMEYCGRACARHHKSIETVKKLQRKTKDIDELLDRLNQQKGFWCGEWMRKGKIIYSVCQECGCPLVRASLVEKSPTFCRCSLGWVKAVFEQALGIPIKVQLIQAKGKGDKVCKYIVRF